MSKNYKSIRLAFNEGKKQDKDRFTWKNDVSELPTQERPEKGQLGYNKHFYEVILSDGRIAKFRLDVCDREDTKFSEEDVREFVANLTKTKADN